MSANRDTITAEPQSRDTFRRNLDAYVSDIEQWFADENPYLNAGFKLDDVRKRLPMNRTYISRIFNEGFGLNFAGVVRDLRLSRARQLLVEHPDLPVNRVAEQCGFASASSFIRAFTRSHDGLTPGAWRRGAQP